MATNSSSNSTSSRKRSSARRKSRRVAKTRTYVVPTIVTGVFGCEMVVEATSVSEAKKLVRAGKGQIEGDGYDWNRWREQSFKIGSWAKVSRANT